MPTQIDIPGAGVIEFPDEMSREEITSTIQNQILPKVTAQPNQFAQRIAHDRATPDLPVKGLFGQIGEALTTPPQFVQDYQPTTQVGRVAKEISNVMYQPATIGSLLPFGAFMRGIGVISKTAPLAADFAKAAVLSPFVAEGLKQLGLGASTVAGQASAGVPLSSPEQAAPIAQAILGGSMATPLAESLGRMPSSGLAANDRAFTDAAGSQLWHEANDLSSRSPTVPTPKATVFPPAASQAASQATTAVLPVKPTQIENTGETNLGHDLKQIATQIKGYTDLGQITPEQSLALQSKGDEIWASGGETKDLQKLVDVSRYQTLTSQIKTASPEQQLKIFRGIEQIKNKYGGNPPQIKESNADVQTTQQQDARQSEGEVSQVASPSTQGQVESQVSTDAGRGSGETRASDKQGDEGRVGQEPSNVQKQDKTGEAGFVLLPQNVFKRLSFESGTKVDPQQMFNRLRNVLGESSETFKTLQSMGLGQFLSQPRTTDELAKWAQENQPKVEVRKFGTKQLDEVSQKGQERMANLEHYLDTKYPNWRGEPSANIDTADYRIKYNELQTLRATQREPSNQSHWQSIAPKSEQDMPGYVEIAVVKPTKNVDIGRTDPESPAGSRRLGIQFPSSHNFPPNTLGFVRGYMENVGGKKVFHVIEVQSDWAQQQRERTKQGDERASRGETVAAPQGDPLLPHYERLALKAAIEHARKEGADAIAVSDAETAMMTEGHDRQNASEYGYDPQDLQDHILRKRESEFIPQSEGMRLHYDRTLPKTSEELTGNKGERVSFGEHKMAVEYEHSSPDGSLQSGKTTPRKDLIFRNPNGSPKTDISARMFKIGEKNPEPKFSLLGRDKGEAGFVINTAPDLIDGIKKGKENLTSFLSNLTTDKFKPLLLKWRGESLPKTAAVNEDLGNQLYLRAQAKGISHVLQSTDPAMVLGEKRYKDNEFANKLGAVLQENKLRAFKQNLLQLAGQEKDPAKKQALLKSANEVETIVGNKRSLFNNEQEFELAKKDPEILDAIERHKEIIQKPAEERHKLLGGKLLKTDEMGAFINSVIKDVSAIPSGVSAKGQGAQIKKTVFGKQFTGTGEHYETDYRKIAARMVQGNYERAALKAYVDKAIKLGVGGFSKWEENDKGQRVLAQPDFGGKGTVKIPQDKVRLLFLDEEGHVTDTSMQNRDFYLRGDLADEFNQVTKDNERINAGALNQFADIMTRVQVSLGVDAMQHVVNQVTSVNSLLHGELGKDVFGPKEINTIQKIVSSIVEKHQNEFDFNQRLGELARQGIVRDYQTYGGILEKIFPKSESKFIKDSPGGRVVRSVDQLSRLLLHDIVVEAAKNGLPVKADPISVRRLVDKQMGQYNPALMSVWNRAIKSVASPFMVAGQTFNRVAIQRLTMSPGLEAINSKAWLELRARQVLLTATAAIVAPMIANQLLNGNPFPPEAKLGQIVWRGKQGQLHTFDTLKPMFLRRAQRITGAGTLMEQQVMPRIRGEQPAELGQTGRQMVMDAFRGFIGPYAGPVPNSLASLTTGKSVAGYEQREPGENKPPYFMAAVRGLNPLIGTAMQGEEKGSQGEKIVNRLGVAVGLGKADPKNIIGNLRRQFLYPLGKSNQAGDAPSEYSPITKLLQEGDVDKAKKIYSDLLQEHIVKHKNAEDPQREALMDFQKYFERYAKTHGQSSQEDEKAFVKTLTPHQQDLYNEAMEQQKKVADVFFSQIQPKLARKGSGFSW